MTVKLGSADTDNVREALSLMHRRSFFTMFDPFVQTAIRDFIATEDLDEAVVLSALVKGLQDRLRSAGYAVGDADDLAILLAAFLKSLGFPVKFRAVREAGQQWFNHIYVLAGIPREAPNRWIPIDLSAPCENVYGNENENEKLSDVRLDL
jgi:hypothetical protein